MKKKKRTIYIVIKWQPVLLLAVSAWSLALNWHRIEINSVIIGFSIGTAFVIVMADSIFEKMKQDVKELFDEIEKIMFE